MIGKSSVSRGVTKKKPSWKHPGERWKSREGGKEGKREKGANNRIQVGSGKCDNRGGGG